jgi:two-component system nitrate/nitrite response regulator NarP
VSVDPSGFQPAEWNESGAPKKVIAFSHTVCYYFSQHRTTRYQIHHPARETMKILLYSSDQILPLGLRSLAASQPGEHEVRAARKALAFVHELESGPPDVILIDQGVESRAEAINLLRLKCPHVPIVLWVRDISIEQASQALGLGVNGILMRNLPVEKVFACLQAVVTGETWYDDELTKGILDHRPTRLSRREGQLTALLSQGLKNKEIANELGITEGTVKVYLSRLYGKLGVKDRFELALTSLANFSGSWNGLDHAPRRLVIRKEAAAA